MVRRVLRAGLASTKLTPVLRHVLIVMEMLTHQREALYLLRASVMQDIQDRMVGRVLRAGLASTKSTLVLRHVSIVMEMLIHQKQALYQLRASVTQDIQEMEGRVRSALRARTRQLRGAVTVLTVL